MRTTRAYVAGFGTAGSLVAGAALLFALASAIVAFRGWPQVGSSPPAPVVVISHARAAQPTVATRRVALVIAALTGPAGALTAPAPPGAAPRTAGAGGPRRAAGPPPSGVVSAAPASPAVTGPGSSAPSGAGGIGAQANLGDVVSGAATTAGGALSAGRRTVDSTVTGVSGTVAGGIDRIIPAAGRAEAVTVVGALLGAHR